MFEEPFLCSKADGRICVQKEDIHAQKETSPEIYP
jgi:hypothetical protein